MQNLSKTYDDITGILLKHKIRGKWCHSGNPLSEAVIGRTLWAKNNWQPEWRFLKNALEKWLTISLRRGLGLGCDWQMCYVTAECSRFYRAISRYDVDGDRPGLAVVTTAIGSNWSGTQWQ